MPRKIKPTVQRNLGRIHPVALDRPQQHVELPDQPPPPKRRVPQGERPRPPMLAAQPDLLFGISDPPPADGSISAVRNLYTKPLSCSFAVQIGDIVYLSGSGTVDQASATSLATASFIGFVVEIPEPLMCVVQVAGNIETFEGLTPLDFYFLSDTPGQISASPGTNSVSIGLALDDTTLLMVPGGQQQTGPVSSGPWAAGTGPHTAVLVGGGNTASDNCSVAEGFATHATGKYSHAEGFAAYASGRYSHAEGNSYAISGGAHAEGRQTHATSYFSHSEGDYTYANGRCSHAEGNHTTANANYAHAEGDHTHANQVAAHAEGVRTYATGHAAHTEGSHTYATALASHAEGYKTHATLPYAHAEGLGGTAGAYGSHVEGRYTSAFGGYSHAEGGHTLAGPYLYTHAEGFFTKATKEGTHAGGYQAYANHLCEFSRACGMFAAQGDAQFSDLVARNATTDATATALTLDGQGYVANSNYLLIPTDTTWHVIARVVAKDDTGHAAVFTRQGYILNNTGTVTVGGVNAVGTDGGTNAGAPPAGWTVTLIAGSNNDLVVQVTGAIATNIRWVAKIELVSVSFPHA